MGFSQGGLLQETFQSGSRRDIVPVVMNMVKPPQITEYVDMRAYFPKTEHSHLPDKFALDYENGVMCGLYLADGCIHEKSDTISITKEDESVQAFVCKWFDKYGITHRLDVCKKEHGVSTSIIGSSTLFAQFFNKWMGHGARVKHIPDVAYTAPEEFVKGLLSGYISGMGLLNRMLFIRVLLRVVSLKASLSYAVVWEPLVKSL